MLHVCRARYCTRTRQQAMPRPGTDRSVPGRSRSPPARSSEPLASGHSPNPNRLSRRIPKAEVTDPFRVTDRHQPGLVCDPLSCGRRTNPTRGDATITKAERHFLICVGSVSTRYSRGRKLENRVQASGKHAVQWDVPNAAPASSVDSPSESAGSRRVFGRLWLLVYSCATASLWLDPCSP